MKCVNIHHLNSILVCLEIQLFDKVTRWNAFFFKLYGPIICELTKCESNTVIGQITKESFVYVYCEIHVQHNLSSMRFNYGIMILLWSLFRSQRRESIGQFLSKMVTYIFFYRYRFLNIIMQ